jgi:hypothetical protein
MSDIVTTDIGTIFTPDWLNPALAPMVAIHRPGLIAACADAHFLQVSIDLRNGADRANAARANGDTVEQNDAKCEALFNLVLMTGADMARATLVDYQKPATRATRAAKDPWTDRSWVDAANGVLTEILQNAAMRSLPVIFDRLITPKGEKTTDGKSPIANNGAPSLASELVARFKAADGDTTAQESVRTDMLQMLMHNQGSHSVLKVPKSAPKIAAIEPVTGKVLHREKDGSVKLVRVAFGFRADGMRKPIKRKTEKAPTADTTTDEKVSTALPE